MKGIGKFKIGEKVWYDVFPLVRHAPGVVVAEGVQSVGVWKRYLDRSGVTPIALWEDLHDITKRKKSSSTIRMKDIKY